MHANDKYEESSTSKCRRFMTWFFQLALWTLIGLLIFNCLLGDTDILAYLPSTIIVYIIYLILELCSSTFSYLLNARNADSVHVLMKTLFSNPILINFHCECYHYRTKVTRNKNGTTTSREKVVTYRGIQSFTYYSWKDVSGTFLLDSSQALMNDKIQFIKLKLDKKFIFNDQYTNMDYQRQYHQFYMTNRWRDTYISTSVVNSIQSFNEFNLVKISDQPVPCLFNKWWFILFTILSLAQFYKYYVDSICSFQFFLIKKQISTRFNLNAAEFREKFEIDAPKITLHHQTTNFYEKETDLLHDTPDLPDEKDLEISEEVNNFMKNNENGNYENFNDNFVAPSNNNNDGQNKNFDNFNENYRRVSYGVNNNNNFNNNFSDNNQNSNNFNNQSNNVNQYSNIGGGNIGNNVNYNSNLNVMNDKSTGELNHQLIDNNYNNNSSVNNTNTNTNTNANSNNNFRYD